MSEKTLYDKVWDLHTIKTLPNGQTLLFIGLHLIHEVTSPQAFEMLRERGLKVAYPELTFATTDHIVPTHSLNRPLSDSLAESMLCALESNVEKNGITFFGLESIHRGIVHVMAPELGLVQPGMTIACGDSHTCTLGAFGAIAMGIGTTKVRDVLAMQSISMQRLKVKRIKVSGSLSRGVYAKDVILHIINKLGVNDGIGFAYEYSGSVFDSFSMDERMTVCNMSIEGGALVGYVNPDNVTFDYLKGRPYAPNKSEFSKFQNWWQSLRSDNNAFYDAEALFSANDIEPMITWGTNPGQSIPVNGRIPNLEEVPESSRDALRFACAHMGFSPGQKIEGVPVDVVFIGSCTNARLSDLREAARILSGRRISKNIRALVVPGSELIKRRAEEEGLDEIFRSAGFEWRHSGCSMCLGMNPDKLEGSELCVSTSNRNFVGRMGSQKGRIVLASPAMAAAAAVEGKIVDVRDYL